MFIHFSTPEIRTLLVPQCPHLLPIARGSLCPLIEMAVHITIHHLKLALELTLENEPTPSAIGRAYNNLGTAYQALNDLDQAQEYYDLALAQAIYGGDQAGQARVYGNIGNLQMLLKNTHTHLLP